MADTTRQRVSMSSYVFGTSLSYNDYLQAQSFESSIKATIDSSTRQLIATHEELTAGQIIAIESSTRALEEISYDLYHIERTLNDLNASIYWGFSEVLATMGRMADSLEELIRIAKNPSKNWAYEQFDDARDAYRKGLYEEALEYLDRAINGYKDHLGYKLEYRFHYLLGTIRIGSFRNNSPTIVDLAQAKSAFLNAAKYAAHDFPREAARGFLAVAWAAYWRGEIDEAETYTKKAIQSRWAEPYFQLAKILMHRGDADRALDPLRQAIVLDRDYAIKAATDGDFRHHKPRVYALIRLLAAKP